MERLSKLVSHLGWGAEPAAAAGQQHVLIVGGTGLVGRACAEHFAAAGWRVTTVARRPLPYSLPASSQHTHLELDLSDREAVKAAILGLSPVTSLIYAAMGTTAADADPSNGTAIDVGDEEGRALNSAMFDNLIDPLEQSHPDALHIQLMQGRLAYGGWAVSPRSPPTPLLFCHHMAPDLCDAAQVAPALFPSREDRPDKTPSWYFDQEDELRARLENHPGWSVTVWRPPAVLGHAAGGHLNVVAALGAYAALRRARGDTTLPRPTASAGFGMAFADQLCDVRLLSSAMGWAAEKAATSDPESVEIYNIDK